MGKPDVQSASGDIPHTRCSNCETVFEVSSALLSSADTRVRCGECLSIFDALACLCSLPPDLAVVGSADTHDSDDSSGTQGTTGEVSKEASAEGFVPSCPRLPISSKPVIYLGLVWTMLKMITMKPSAIRCLCEMQQ